MATTIKEFLVKLEAPDGKLLDEYRGKKTKKEREEIAVREGLDEDQARVLQSGSVDKIRKAIVKEGGGGGQLLFVVMLD